MARMPYMVVRKGRLIVGGLTAVFGLLLALPLPVWAQDTSTVATSTVAPTFISLFLLVIGLVAVGIVGARVVIAPGLNPKLSAAAFADDDDEVIDPAAGDKLA